MTGRPLPDNLSRIEHRRELDRERQRLCRARRKAGINHIGQVEIYDSVIEALIDSGRIVEDADNAAIDEAVARLVEDWATGALEPINVDDR